MKSYYSIIRYVNNPLSKENLAIGMILISGKSIFYRFSNNKIKLAHKINHQNGDLLDYTVEKILAFIKNDLKNEIDLFPGENAVNVEYLNRLSIYNNGFLQFDKPSALNMGFDKSGFEDFFKKYVEVIIPVQKKKIIDRSFNRTIKQVFKEPLKDKINLDYRIKKESVPNLFFDYTVDGIGVNGSIYTLKSIDLNSEKPIDNYRRDISELESLNYRLDLFGEKNGLKANENKHFLLINPYKGSKGSYHDLYEVLKEQDEEDFPYRLIGSEDLPDVTAEFKKSRSIKKFTEFISSL
ncbi:hypothetical protein [Salinimicrobium sp. HB62]|uniref:hypothetical protein n=1 Tax=Salinimicrobium sp. HB62 TaxID=3077781 RepID=UPI002D796301|nr:hypothetical protein [Salinimicrobium sp. HB62]